MADKLMSMGELQFWSFIASLEVAACVYFALSRKPETASAWAAASAWTVLMVIRQLLMTIADRIK